MPSCSLAIVFCDTTIIHSNTTHIALAPPNEYILLQNEGGEKAVGDNGREYVTKRGSIGAGDQISGKKGEGMRNKEGREL
jgi:hypothetical protein